MWNEIALAHTARRLPYSMAPTDPCVFSTLRVARLETTQLPVRNNCWASRHFKGDAGPAEGRVQLLDWPPCGASQNAFLSEAGDFFLKVHDSLKSCVPILKLGRVQSRLLCENMDLELDQSIDLLPEGKEQWLFHREQFAPVRCAF